MNNSDQNTMQQKPEGGLSIKQNVLWNTVGCTLYQGCQWLTTILVVILSPSYENSGLLAFAMATGNIFSGLASYNMYTYQISDVDNRFSSRNYVAFRFFTILASLIIAVAYSALIGIGAASLIVVIEYLFFKSDEVFVTVLYAIDQRALRMDIIGISQGIRAVISIAAFSGGLILFSSLDIAIISMFLGCALVTVFYDLPHARRFERVLPNIDLSRVIEMLKIGFPLVLASFLYLAVAAIARQWFGVRFGDVALGIYAAVATPCALVQVMARYFYNPFLVPLANHWQSRENADFTKLLRKLLLITSAIVLACVALTVILGPSIVELIYGDEIVDYSWLIIPAMIAAALMAVSTLFTDLFILLRKFKQAVIINLIAFFVCIAGSNICFDHWYMNGINLILIFSFAIGTIVGLFFLVSIVRKRNSE